MRKNTGILSENDPYFLISIAMIFQLLSNKQRIKVNVKLLAGLDSKEGYDSHKGIELEVMEGTKLRKAIKQINLPQDQPISFIINGEKVNDSARLKEGDEIFCFLPFAGG